MSNHDNGSISPQFLIVILVLSSFALGAILITRATLQLETRYLSKTGDFEEILVINKQLIDLLLSDTTPEADTRDDPIWQAQDTIYGAYSVKIEPLTSRINPNYARKNLFEKTALANLFKPGQDAATLQQYREDSGLSLNEDHYSTLFETEKYSDFFSPYGWANINLIDEFAASSLVRYITGSESTGENVRNEIQNLLQEQRLVTRAELDSTLGKIDRRLPVFLNAEPMINVNFVDPYILNEILSYPEYAVNNPSQKAQAIQELANGGGVYPNDLSLILQIDETKRLYYYFGTTTWFWKFSFESPDAAYEAVICRLPPHSAEAIKNPTYQMIELRRSR